MQVRNLIHCLSNIVAISIQNIAKKVNKVDESVAWRRNYKIYEENFRKEAGTQRQTQMLRTKESNNPP